MVSAGLRTAFLARGRALLSLAEGCRISNRYVFVFVFSCWGRQQYDMLSSSLGRCVSLVFYFFSRTFLAAKSVSGKKKKSLFIPTVVLRRMLVLKVLKKHRCGLDSRAASGLVHAPRQLRTDKIILRHSIGLRNAQRVARKVACFLLLFFFFSSAVALLSATAE